MPRHVQTTAVTAQVRTRPHWAIVVFSAVTMLSAAAVGLTATDLFTRLTMLGGILACIAVWQTVRDPVVTACLLTMVLGAVLGWGLDLYGRIWWYDDAVHFLSSFVGVIAVARLTLRRFRAESTLLLLAALWLSWLGIGSLWEIAEWTSDRLNGTGHSRGYADTMTDMILNSVGSALGVWVAWRWLSTDNARSQTVASRAARDSQ